MGKSRGNRLNRETLYLPASNTNGYSFKKVGTRVTLADMCGINPSSATQFPIKKFNGKIVGLTFDGWTNVTQFPPADLKDADYSSFGTLFMGCAMVENVDMRDYNIENNPNFNGTSDVGLYYSTFGGCTNLKGVVLPFSPNYEWTFYNTLTGCTSLTDITFVIDNDSLRFSNNNCKFSDCPLNERTLLQLADKLAYVTTTHAFSLKQSTSEATLDKYVKKDENGNLVVCESTDPEAIGTLSQYFTSKGWTLTLV